MMAYIERVKFYQPEITKALVETSYMLGVSLIGAIAIGLPLGTLIYLTRRKGVMENRWVARLLNSYVNIIRSFPFLLFVVALIPFTRWLIGTSFGTYAASVPLVFVSGAIYGRLVEQVLLDVPEEIVELGQALGANKSQFVFHFLFVEARSGLVLSLTSVLISMVSYSTVLGIVGGGGIGDFAIRYGYQRYEYDIMYTTIAIMILGVGSVQLIGTTIAKVIDKRKN